MSAGSYRRVQWFAGAVLALSVALTSDVARADDIPVPADLQATLLGKVIGYDRNLPERAGDRVRIVLVGKPGDPTSMPFVRQLRQALEGMGPLADLPHSEEVIEFTTAAALAEKCRNDHTSIVYFGPGFRNDVDAIRSSLEGLSVLTVSASPDDVAHGIVLGFDLSYGRPKLVLHLGQARRQQVNLRADVLKLMRIVDE